MRKFRKLYFAVRRWYFKTFDQPWNLFRFWVCFKFCGQPGISFIYGPWSLGVAFYRVPFSWKLKSDGPYWKEYPFHSKSFLSFGILYCSWTIRTGISVHLG